MHYLIDGYNFLFHFVEPEQKIHFGKEELVLLLHEWACQVKGEVTVVLDTQHPAHAGDMFIEHNHRFTIRFSPDNLCADRYLIELIQWLQGKAILVTSDKELIKNSRALGSRVVQPKEFLQMIRKKKKQTDQSSGKNTAESYADRERLYRKFSRKWEKMQEIERGE